MKMKSIAMLAISGLLTLSCTARAAAADGDMGTSPSGQSMQQPYNYNAPNQSNEMLGNMPQNENMNNNNPNEISPDTATGDDDY